MISLFDYDDLEMRLCKSGDFERDNSQRWNANNSAVWPERGLDQIQVIEQVLDMVKSQRGEPGIFNRQATIDLQPERRQPVRLHRIPDQSLRHGRYLGANGRRSAPGARTGRSTTRDAH